MVGGVRVGKEQMLGASPVITSEARCYLYKLVNQGFEDVPSQLKTLPGFNLLINKLLSTLKKKKKK